jgi:septal ring factor EnvC (AmiA/AmiB activator)
MAQSDLLRLKGSIEDVARKAAGMASTLGVLRKELDAAAARAQGQVQGTAQQQRYAAMIAAYQQAAAACDSAVDALVKAGRAGTDIGKSL